MSPRTAVTTIARELRQLALDDLEALEWVDLTAQPIKQSSSP